MPDGRTLDEIREVEQYIQIARDKEIESLRKAELRRASQTMANMSTNDQVKPSSPHDSPEVKSLPITGSDVASTSKSTSSAPTLDGTFLNENWRYDLVSETLTDLQLGYAYNVAWLDVL